MAITSRPRKISSAIFGLFAAQAAFSRGITLFNAGLSHRFRGCVVAGVVGLLAAATPALSDQLPDFAALARASGTPEIPGLKIVWLAPWGDPAKANPWHNIIAHQTEGPAGSARGG